MFKKYSKNIAIGALLAITIAAVGIYTSVIKLPIEQKMYSQLISGLDNNEILIGASHNVFVGRVIKEVGNEKIGKRPQTQFSVKVIHNIKGNLENDVIVNQLGGYRNGMLITYNDSSLLAHGETYLFATRYDKEKEWYTLSSHENGQHLISKDLDLKEADVVNNLKVEQMKESYKNEVLLDADLRHNNTLNSYKSLKSVK